MTDPTHTTRFRCWLWLIRLVGVIVPRRLRADWRQEWEAELRAAQGGQKRQSPRLLHGSLTSSSKASHGQTLVRDRAAVANRSQKLLESANIKLGQVATEVLGFSGRLRLKALADGERDAEKRARAGRLQ